MNLPNFILLWEHLNKSEFTCLDFSYTAAESPCIIHLKSLNLTQFGKVENNAIQVSQQYKRN